VKFMVYYLLSGWTRSLILLYRLNRKKLQKYKFTRGTWIIKCIRSPLEWIFKDSIPQKVFLRNSLEHNIESHQIF
jgi:hypothetical protein